MMPFSILLLLLFFLIVCRHGALLCKGIYEYDTLLSRLWICFGQYDWTDFSFHGRFWQTPTETEDYFALSDSSLLQDALLYKE